METLKQTILTNWNFMRWLRLAIGLALLIQGIYLRDMIPGFVGAWFSYLALINASCCGVGGCDISQSVTNNKSQKNMEEGLTFEEIKKDKF